MILNKRQHMVGWTMILLISAAFLRTILTVPPDQCIYTKVFLTFYFYICIIGIPLVYVLRDKKK
jgi:hypothetical protein